MLKNYRFSFALRSCFIFLLQLIFHSTISAQVLSSASSINTIVDSIPNPSHPENYFGAHALLNNNFLFVSATTENVNAEEAAGALFIYKFDNNRWNLHQKLVSLIPESYAHWGSEFQVSTDLLFVPIHSSKREIGSLIVIGELYEYKNDKWTLVKQITSGYKNSAYEAALNDEFLFITQYDKFEYMYDKEGKEINWKTSSWDKMDALSKTSGQIDNDGLVHFYSKSANWELTQIIRLDSVQEKEHRNLGKEIAVYEKTLALSAYSRNILVENKFTKGSIFIYEYVNGNWGFKTIIQPDVPEMSYFGRKVQFTSKDTILVIQDQPVFNSEKMIKLDKKYNLYGHYYFYKKIENEWKLVSKKTIPSPPDREYQECCHYQDFDKNQLFFIEYNTRDEDVNRPGYVLIGRRM